MRRLISIYHARCSKFFEKSTSVLQAIQGSRLNGQLCFSNFRGLVDALLMHSDSSGGMRQTQPLAVRARRSFAGPWVQHANTAQWCAGIRTAHL